MKIEELKIGDKIKFKSSDKGHINIGYIITKAINNDWWVSENQTIGTACLAQNWCIDNKDIICKLIPISEYLNYEPCYKEIPIEKESSAPKSFKFDISFVNRVEFDQQPYLPDSIPSCYFKIDGYDIKYHPNNPDIWHMNGKTYTIEIKEKE